MSSTASECDKHFFLACYSLPRVRPYIPLVVSSPIDVEVTTSPCVDWELPNPIVESPASPNEPTHTEATTTTTPPLDGADETEATSQKLDGEYDPEFCGYGVRTSPVSSDADTDSLPEFRVKATVSSLPAAGASMGGPRSPTPPTANWSWSSDEDEDDNYRGFLEDCSNAVLQHVRRVTNTDCRALVGNEVRACVSALLREIMEPAFLDDIINAFLD